MSSNEMPACGSWRRDGSGESGQPPVRRKGFRVLGGCMLGLGGSWLYLLIFTDLGQLRTCTRSFKSSFLWAFPFWSPPWDRTLWWTDITVLNTLLVTPQPQNIASEPLSESTGHPDWSLSAPHLIHCPISPIQISINLS